MDNRKYGHRACRDVDYELLGNSGQFRINCGVIRNQKKTQITAERLLFATFEFA